jgi:RNA polymerase sigma factor (sigma-70 family)
VDRYVGLVYSAALRQVREPALSEDICQAVFLILARKAKSLQPGVILPGWLIRTTHLCALDTLKTESRRRVREQRYAAMAPTETPFIDTASEGDSAALATAVDRALAHLGDVDRGAIVLRYMEDQPVARVAAALGLSEDAASKRLQRALVKLRDYFVRHPITPSVAVIAATMEHLPRGTPPTALSTLISSAAAGGGAAAVTGSSASMAKAAIKVMFWTKAKLTAAAVAVALLGTAAVGTMSIVRAQAQSPSPTSSQAITPPAVDTPASSGSGSGSGGGAIGKLADGVSIELIGLSNSPSNGKNWWRADGTSLPDAPYAKMNGRYHIESGTADVSREAAVRINRKLDKDAESATVWWGLQPSSGSMGGGMNRPRSPDVEGEIFSIPAGSPVTVRADVAAGPWATLFTAGPNGQSGGMTQPGGGGLSYSVSPGFANNGRTYFAVAVSHEDGAASAGKRSRDYRVVVIDKAGHQEVANGGGSATGGSTMAGTYNTSVPPTNIQQLLYQSRPFDQWIEIRNVCIDPAHPTQPTIATSDAPPGL